jgi:predicted nucleic acid-binding protein
MEAKTSAEKAGLARMKPVVYDTSVLIAAEGNDRKLWAEHRLRLEAGNVPVVSATVVAQASRSSRQVQLLRLLRGCEVVALEEADAHRVGALLGKSRTKDIVDAAVVVLAMDRKADVQTGDPDDIRRLSGTARARLRTLSL